jgi:hypothetical protein
MQETSSIGVGVLSSSLKTATTEVKGWVTKIQFQRGRLTREQMHHLPFYWIALWLWFKKVFLRVHSNFVCDNLFTTLGKI